MNGNKKTKNKSYFNQERHESNSYFRSKFIIFLIVSSLFGMIYVANLTFFTNQKEGFIILVSDRDNEEEIHFDSKTDEAVTVEPIMRIIVLTMNRYKSVERLLNSLDNAFYDNHRVDLDIWIDRDSKTGIHNQTAFVSNQFNWSYGSKTVHYQKNNVGLRAQWLYSFGKSIFKPLSTELTQKILILEDDLEVSPYFFRWLLEAHSLYGNRQEITGFTLQRLTLCPKEDCPNLTGGPVGFDSGVFGMQLIGSWGYSPTVSFWINFLKWVDELDEVKNPPFILGLKPTDWYQREIRSGRCPTRPSCIWTILHLKYCDDHFDRFTIYAKASKKVTLATNHKEKGLHFVGGGSTIDFPKLMEYDEAIFSLPFDLKLAGYDGEIIFKPIIKHIEILLKYETTVEVHFVSLIPKKNPSKTTLFVIRNRELYLKALDLKLKYSIFDETDENTFLSSLKQNNLSQIILVKNKYRLSKA